MIRFHILTICAMALSVAVAGCGPAEPEAPGSPALSQVEAEAMANEQNDVFDAALNSGDADALAELYAEDAIRFEPNSPARVGREAIRAAFQARQSNSRSTSRTV